MRNKIPPTVLRLAQALEARGFEAYLVGGCVRDLFLKREPKDWDIATNAKPEEVQGIFPEHVYENQFGTVGVKTEDEDPKLKVVEVTTYRLEGTYTDKRHPDEVKFAKSIEEDLSRRDFTVNAMALRVDGASEVVDPFGGEEDLKKGTIRTVGNPRDRFNEDALRLMRAVRFAVELDFRIEKETRVAIEELAGLLEAISKERIRDEFAKMIMTPRAAQGILLLEELGLLRYILPELREGLGVEQNLHHIYTVFEHSVRALDYAAKENYPLEVRLAALLHDVGKPGTKGGEGKYATFHAHEMLGAKMAARALERLRFPREVIDKTVHLVRYHMFFYNVGEVSEAGVRRFLARVGPENVPDLIKLREADRIGSGVPKAVPYKLRHLLFMIDKVKRDPISPKMLKTDGEDVMRLTGAGPGPRVGFILAILLEEVIEDPKRNTAEHLEARIDELNRLGDAELKALSQKAKERAEEFEASEEKEIKKKHKV